MEYPGLVANICVTSPQNHAPEVVMVPLGKCLVNQGYEDDATSETHCGRDPCYLGKITENNACDSRQMSLRGAFRKSETVWAYWICSP